MCFLHSKWTFFVAMQVLHTACDLMIGHSGNIQAEQTLDRIVSSNLSSEPSKVPR
jgi:hypothetical protein